MLRMPSPKIRRGSGVLLGFCNCTASRFSADFSANRSNCSQLFLWSMLYKSATECSITGCLEGKLHSVPPALQCSSHLSRQSESSASAAVLDNPDSGSGERFLPHPERLLFRRPDRLPAFHTAQHPANARRTRNHFRNDFSGFPHNNRIAQTNALFCDEILIVQRRTGNVCACQPNRFKYGNWRDDARSANAVENF